jgi:hypothetical protein
LLNYCNNTGDTAAANAASEGAVSNSRKSQKWGSVQDVAEQSMLAAKE